MMNANQKVPAPEMEKQNKNWNWRTTNLLYAMPTIFDPFQNSNDAHSISVDTLRCMACRQFKTHMGSDLCTRELFQLIFTVNNNNFVRNKPVIRNYVQILQILFTNLLIHFTLKLVKFFCRIMEENWRSSWRLQIKHISNHQLESIIYPSFSENISILRQQFWMRQVEKEQTKTHLQNGTRLLTKGTY